MMLKMSLLQDHMTNKTLPQMGGMWKCNKEMKLKDVENKLMLETNCDIDYIE